MTFLVQTYCWHCGRQFAADELAGDELAPMLRMPPQPVGVLIHFDEPSYWMLRLKCSRCLAAEQLGERGTK